MSRTVLGGTQRLSAAMNPSRRCPLEEVCRLTRILHTRRHWKIQLRTAHTVIHRHGTTGCRCDESPPHSFTCYPQSSSHQSPPPSGTTGEKRGSAEVRRTSTIGRPAALCEFSSRVTSIDFAIRRAGGKGPIVSTLIPGRGSSIPSHGVHSPLGMERRNRLLSHG